MPSSPTPPSPRRGGRAGGAAARARPDRPGALRPFVVAGLVDAGRTVLAVTATGREAEDLVAAARRPRRPDAVGYYPSWETLPHERLSPRSDTVGRRLAVLRRLCHPGADPPTARSGSSSRRCARCSSRRSGPRRPRAGGAGAGRRGPARGRRPPPGRRGVHPRRPGREARRVRGPRRHRRRVPADRGAPAAGGVLGRRRRGDPRVRGRRPAHARDRSSGSGRRRAASCC